MSDPKKTSSIFETLKQAVAATSGYDVELRSKVPGHDKLLLTLTFARGDGTKASSLHTRHHEARHQDTDLNGLLRFERDNPQHGKRDTVEYNALAEQFCAVLDRVKTHASEKTWNGTIERSTSSVTASRALGEGKSMQFKLDVQTFWCPFNGDHSQLQWEWMPSSHGGDSPFDKKSEGLAEGFPSIQLMVYQALKARGMHGEIDGSSIEERNLRVPVGQNKFRDLHVRTSLRVDFTEHSDSTINCLRQTVGGHLLPIPGETNVRAEIAGKLQQMLTEAVSEINDIIEYEISVPLTSYRSDNCVLDVSWADAERRSVKIEFSADPSVVSDSGDSVRRHVQPPPPFYPTEKPITLEAQDSGTPSLLEGDEPYIVIS